MIYEMIDKCAEKSSIINSMLNCEKITLSDFVDIQTEKVVYNRNISTLQKYEDIYSVVEINMKNKFDEGIIKEVIDTLEFRVVNTANHFGGIYSPQSFQGDILFSLLLEKMGGSIDAVPIPATTVVPLCNCTNPRAIVLYHESKSPYCIPLLPSKDKNSIVESASAYSVEKIKKMMPAIKSNPDLKSIRNELSDLIENVYYIDEIAEKNSFCDQVPLLEYTISKKIFSEEGPGFIYLEMEKLFESLVIKDLDNKNSLLYHVLFDDEVIKAINEPDPETGECFSWFIFKGIDSKKRIFKLTLTDKNSLIGKTNNGEEVRFHADAESIKQLLMERKICSGTGLSAIVSFFARGLTWLGGAFQSEYLPKMQRMLSEALKKANYIDLSQYVELWKCNGYISGPIFMLSETTDGGLVNAGPVECLKNRILWNRIKELVSNTTVSNAHIMGMFEFYADFVSAKEKGKDWYREIALYCQKYFQSNKI